MKRSILFLWLLLIAIVAAEPGPQFLLKGEEEERPVLSLNARWVALERWRLDEIWVWDLVSGKKLRPLKGMARPLTIDFTPNGRYLAVSDYPRWVGLFDCQSNLRKVWEFKGPLEGQRGEEAGAYVLYFSPDGKRLLIGGGSHGRCVHDPHVYLLETSTGKVIKRFPGWRGRKNLYSGMAWDPSGPGFVYASGKTLESYSRDGEKLAEVELPWRFGGFEERAKELICIMMRETSDEYQYQWLKLGLPQFKLSTPEAYHQEVLNVSPDGALRWTKNSAKQVEVWNGDQKIFESAESSEFQHWVPGAGFVADNRVYDQQGQLLRDLKGKFGKVSASGHFLAGLVGYSSAADFVDLRDGKLLGHYDCASGGSFSQDGRAFATVLKSGLLVVDVPRSLQQGKLVLFRSAH